MMMMIPLFHEKLLNLRPCPSLLLSTKNGPISCVAPYPTEEHPGPTTPNYLVTLTDNICHFYNLK